MSSCLSDTRSPSATAAFDDVDGFFNALEGTSTGPTFTVNITEPNDLSGDPLSSPLRLDYSISDTAGILVSQTDVGVTLAGGSSTFSVTPPRVNLLADGVLVLNITLRDDAGNPNSLLAPADTIILGMSKMCFCP